MDVGFPVAWTPDAAEDRLDIVKDAVDLAFVRSELGYPDADEGAFGPLMDALPDGKRRHDGAVDVNAVLDRLRRIHKRNREGSPHRLQNLYVGMAVCRKKHELPREDVTHSDGKVASRPLTKLCQRDRSA